MLKTYKVQLLESNNRYCHEFISDDQVMIAYPSDHYIDKSVETELGVFGWVDKHPSILRIITADRFDDGTVIHYENFMHVNTEKTVRKLNDYVTIKAGSIHDIIEFYRSHEYDNTCNSKCVSEEMILDQIDGIINDQIKFGKFYPVTKNQIVMWRKNQIGTSCIGNHT